MANAVNTGSINMPKMLRHLSHRTNQVRDLVFVRDAIKRKDIKTTGQTSATKGSSTALAGPAVNFGYETNSSATQSASTDTAYHVNSPELILPGLKAIQSPITSRSGQHERSGHRITGACKFYLPSLDHIRSLDNFSETANFSEIETNDKLIDMERVIFTAFDIEGALDDQTTGGYLNRGYKDGGGMASGNASASTVVSWDNTTLRPPGYEMDRIQFQVKSAGTIDHITIDGMVSGSVKALRWDCNIAMSASKFATIDLPLRKDNGEPFASGDTTLAYVDGIAYTLTAGDAGESGMIDLNKMVGITAADADGSENYFDSIYIRFTASVAHTIRFLKIYSAAEWRVDSIKDYRDEYMEIGAVRVRGERVSRRRTYG